MNLNPKSEYLNPKQFLNPNSPNYKLASFGILEFRTSDLFRISDFGFRIFAVSILCSLLFVMNTFAQDNSKLVSLSKQIIEAKTSDDAYPILKGLTELYLKEHKYNECVDYLKSLINRRKNLAPLINYYIGFARYYQLRYLEETQAWDEYFKEGNSYRDEIVASLQKTIEAVNSPDALGVYVRLILWKFHKDQNDTLSDAALSNLMNFILSYAKEAKDLAVIKEVAGECSSYGEKTNARDLYKIYLDKIATSQINHEELKAVALGFYNEGNLDLAEGVYDVYIERMAGSLGKEKLAPLLTEIAKIFVYPECRDLVNIASGSRSDSSSGGFIRDKDQGLSDALYAEKVFQKIEEIGTKDVFDEELIYLRAFNLEKAKEYQKAKDLYLDLAQRYPQSPYADEAYFKVGIIYTYILRDLKTGWSYFEKLTKKETPTPQTISSLYQLGLLSQWKEDLTKAKEYYHKLLEKAKESFAETVALAEERLKEIEETKPIDYNLKRFLDASLTEEYAHLDTSKINLKPHPYRAKKKERVNINSAAYTAESGCFEVDLQYLWSGHLGQTGSLPAESAFNTSYNQAGTKEINLVVVSPAGIIERSIDLLDVEESP